MSPPALQVGDITLENNVLLAPMSGVTDASFRTLAAETGAGLVVSEMIASHDLLVNGRDAKRKLKPGSSGPFVVQLAGREAHWMGEGAKLVADAGTDIIDINMGCPAKKVTSGYSGSALMRDLGQALKLIEATVRAVDVPVTLKMRLGWDETSINAPELAKKAENAGVQLITVHGRTRCQFYNGDANWGAVRDVVDAVAVPVVVNGDIITYDDAREAQEASGAAAVMIGRGAYGRPWWPGHMARSMEMGCPEVEPDMPWQRDFLFRHFEMMLREHGEEMGLRNARKHIGWAMERVMHDLPALSAWRGRILRSDCVRFVRDELGAFYDCVDEKRCAA